MPLKSLENHRKAQAERLQAILHDLLTEEENKYCADCDAKQPRWASWNLGVFVCIRCAGIHRSIGVQVSKVKSVNLDSWTPEQVQSMRVMGNAKAKAIYEAELPRDYRRPQTEQQLEMFIRAKYEHKRYILRDWQPPKIDVADLIPALEKGQHRNSFKKIQSSQTASNSNFTLQSPKQANTNQQSQASESILDMQLLDFSDSSPTSSSNGVNQKGGHQNTAFATNKNKTKDLPVAIDALRITDKADGSADDELDDMFGPIVSAPRLESHSELPNEGATTVSSASMEEGSVPQSTSSNALGDLAALAAPSTTGAAAKKSNADILALFGKEPLVRPNFQNMNNSQFLQNSCPDEAIPGISACNPQFRFPAQTAFPNNAAGYNTSGSSQSQQQFAPVDGMMGGFMNTETFAIFAAASPFATASGPAVPSCSLLGTTAEQISCMTQPTAAVPSGLNGSTIGMSTYPSGLPDLGGSVSNSTTMSSSVNSQEQWPSTLGNNSLYNSQFQSKPTKAGNGDLKDPFASLDNCFTNFDQFLSNKTTGMPRTETGNATSASTVTSDASLGI